MTDVEANTYLNWILYAIVGRMAEADALMRQRGRDVRRVADELMAQHPVEPAMLYRGVLLDPDRPFTSDHDYTFQSWTDDYEVARWFASPTSYISSLFAEYHPEARGFVMMLPAAPTRVLFHYSWARAFGLPLERFATMNPLIGAEGARQLAWSLRTQSEVILEPLAVLPTATPVEAYEGAPIAELDRRFSPPWTIPAGWLS